MDTELRVDARGLACPLPVVKTKKAIENIDSGKVVAIVDNTVARDNIMKLAQGLSLPVDVVADGTDFILSIMKGGGVAVAEPETGSEAAVLPERSGKNVVILFQADTIGRPEQAGRCACKVISLCFNRVHTDSADFDFLKRWGAFNLYRFRSITQSKNVRGSRSRDFILWHMLGLFGAKGRT